MVHVTGEIDVSNVVNLGSAFSAAEDTTASRVVIDLTETRFIDSSGISALSQLNKRLEGQNRTAVLICPSTNVDVSRILGLMGLGQAIEIFDSLDEALSN